MVGCPVRPHAGGDGEIDDGGGDGGCIDQVAGGLHWVGDVRGRRCDYCQVDPEGSKLGIVRARSRREVISDSELDPLVGVDDRGDRDLAEGGGEVYTACSDERDCLIKPHGGGYEVIAVSTGAWNRTRPLLNR